MKRWLKFKIDIFKIKHFSKPKKRCGNCKYGYRKDGWANKGTCCSIDWKKTNPSDVCNLHEYDYRLHEVTEYKKYLIEKRIKKYTISRRVIKESE
jgi:hypothetical protein